MKKAALTVALLMIAALNLNAQTVTTTNILEEQTRGTGSYLSAEIPLPAVLGNYGSVGFTFLLSPSAQKDPNTRYHVSIEVYNANVDPPRWEPDAGGEMVGPFRDKAGNYVNPTYRTSMYGREGKPVRVVVSLPESMRIGVDASYTNP